VTKILIKRGQAEANLPTLDPGEPAITFDSGGKLWIGTPSGNLEITGGGSGSPGGSDTQLQFNNSGSFGGATSLIYDNSLNDFRIYGDGNNSLFHSDFSANTIGFGTNGATGTIALFSPSIIVYNEDGQDVDFRVEGENFSNLFKVDAGLDAVQIGTSAAGTVADFRSSGTVFNDEGEDRDFRIEGDAATNLVVIDAGLDAFQVGTTVAGAIADFRSTAIVLNNAEADVNFRIAGNGVTNGYFYDAGLDRHGFGTGSPGAAVYIDNTETSGTPETGLTVDNTYSPGSDPGSVFPTSLSLLADYDSSITPSGGFALAQFLRVRNVANGVMSARCLDIIFQNLGNGTASFFTGVNVRTPTNSGGGAITTAYGLKIENQNIAGTNYAIYTDAGRVRFGDSVTVSGFLNVGTTSNPPAGSNIAHISGTSPGFYFTETDTTDNNLFFVLDTSLMQFQNRTDAGTVSSIPFILDLTSATNTFRISSSRVGIGAEPTNVSAKLEIAGTTGAVLLPRLTTTQQNALTAVNGMIVYNSTTGKFTGYAGGAWVALH